MGISKKETILNVWDQSNITKPNQQDLQKFNIDDLMASIFCPGPFYWYIVNFANKTIDYVHPNVEEILGIQPDDFTLEKLLEQVHQEDIQYMAKFEEMIISFMTKNITPDEYFNYKMSYKLRIRHTKGHYKHLYHQALTLTTDRKGNVLQVLGIHTEIDHISTETDRTVSFWGLMVDLLIVELALTMIFVALAVVNQYFQKGKLKLFRK